MDKQLSSDQELIEQYLSGSQKSLEILINRHKRKIFSSIFLLARDKDLSEDIFQDTFIKAIQTIRAGQYNEEGKFLPWIQRIAHNLVIDHFRREKRMPMSRDTEEYSVIDNLSLADGNAEDDILKTQLRKELRRLVNELPFEQREVLIMRHFADMSFKEIADTTGVSINTALGRMRYALINLRRMIADQKLVLAAA